VPISPPTGLTAVKNGDTINLTWLANLEGDRAGYKVYYDIDSGYPYEGTYHGFDERGAYQVVVYAEDGAGNQATPQSATVRVGYEVYLPLVLKQN